MRQLSKGDDFGPYTITRLLGVGAMGCVYLAVTPEGEKRALKLCTSDRPGAAARFAREIEVGRSLDHPNVVRVLEAGEAEGIEFLGMEYVRGKNLEVVLGEVGGRLHPRYVLRLSRQLGHGLQAFHDGGFIHRDLKPANVLMGADGRAKIADFGLVRDPDATRVTKTGALVGTPFYMAPEQVLGQKAGPAADMFAMTLVLYQALTGNHAFAMDSELKAPLNYLLRLPKAVPRPWHPRAADGPLDRVFRRALLPRPEDRYASALSLARAIDRAFREEKRGGRSVQATQRLSRVVKT